MNREKLFQNAKDHCFFIGLADSGAELCKANIPYGIAGIHYVQQQFGMTPNATFISCPDMTITRGVNRWRSGFAYGGKVSWGKGDDELIILNVQPDVCGMLVGGLGDLPDAERLIKRLHDIQMDTVEIDRIKVVWNFYTSNHFIDLFRVQPVTKIDPELPPYVFVIHGSACELHRDNESGFGLFYDASTQLQDMIEVVETPFGRLHVLTGSDAKRYYERHQYADDFSRRKKRLAAELLFGEFTEISNQNHQGLINMNEIVLGCCYLEDDVTLFPVTLKPDLPAYLVRGNRNLTPENIELLGFEKRANRLGLYDRLLHANIIPHGGGYTLPDVLTVNKVIEIAGARYFDLEMQNDRGRQIISEVHDLPYEYRGRTVVLRALEAGLMQIVAKLLPQYVLKI